MLVLYRKIYEGFGDLTTSSSIYFMLERKWLESMQKMLKFLQIYDEKEPIQPKLVFLLVEKFS